MRNRDEIRLGLVNEKATSETGHCCIRSPRVVHAAVPAESRSRPSTAACRRPGSEGRRRSGGRHAGGMEEGRRQSAAGEEMRST